MADGPLQDIRVIDLGHDYSAPFAASLLADFGADVIAVERPGVGDVMRDVGPSGPTGPVVWKSAGRGKRSLALDWKHPKARGVLEKLARISDVLVESYRPGVLERNGLGPDVLHAWNSDLVILRVSGYGQTGAYGDRPGFGKAAEAYSGACDISGFADGPPVHPGFPMADMTTGLMGAYAIMLALHARETNMARGQVIDLALYETLLRLIDFHIPVRTGVGLVPKRNSNRHPLSLALSGMYQTRDRKWVTYSAGSYAVAKRVLALIGGDAWASDSRFCSLRDICRYDDEIHERMTAWMAQRDTEEVLRSFRNARAVAEFVHDVDDILADPNIAARQNIIGFDGEPCRVVNVVPKLDKTPGRVRWLGRRRVGEDSIDVLRDVLKLDQAVIRDLVESGAVDTGVRQSR
jgi:succinyl-CoA--D-citramalate CoA-transferase